MSTDFTKQLLYEILVKKAKGYAYKERTDEYAISDGQKKLVRSKTVTKRMPPDLGAVKVLLSLNDDGADVTKMTDSQLQEEKLRLIRLLEEAERQYPDQKSTSKQGE